MCPPVLKLDTELTWNKLEGQNYHSVSYIPNKKKYFKSHFCPLVLRLFPHPLVNRPIENFQWKIYKFRSKKSITFTYNPSLPYQLASTHCLRHKEKLRKQVYQDSRGDGQALGKRRAGDVLVHARVFTCCQKGRGGCLVGERIIKGFVQNAEMKEEDENNDDKIRRALISFLSPVSCLPGPEKEHSEHIRMSYRNSSILC